MWWEYYRLCDLSDEELIEDKSALGGLEYLGVVEETTAPLKRSELTEITFKQGGRSILVSAPNPHRPHVGVPGALSAGEVQLQVRTWRDGRPSAWSDPIQFRLSEKPVPPSVGAIRLEKGNWVQLWPGPDRQKSFSASAGDLIVINGSFPVADASKLKVSLTGSAGSMDLTVSELDEKADWFSEVCVKLPDTLEKGDWRMTVASADDSAHVELPIVIHIE